MGASVGERGNVQTRGGNRVSTISLLGCSTSVALTTGPIDEEEKVTAKLLSSVQGLVPRLVTTFTAQVHNSVVQLKPLHNFALNN